MLFGMTRLQGQASAGAAQRCTCLLFTFALVKRKRGSPGYNRLPVSAAVSSHYH